APGGTRRPAAPPARVPVPGSRSVAGRAPAAGSAARVAVNASPMVGKVFLTKSDGDYVCSGSALNSESGNVVLTAGHCVYDGGWVRNFTFVPYYDHGKRPFGSWAAARLRTFRGWTDHGDFHYDVGMVNVWDNDRTLVATVGGEGISTSDSAGRLPDVIAIGYPSEGPYDGTWQYYCRGDATRADGRMRLPCGLTRGVSGGPWLLDYSDATGIGYASGVFSTIDRVTDPRTAYSPPFGSAVWDLYQSAQVYRPA
ncbi:hypothetical protein RKE29_01860, partial [Streptomyces sp. B1866]|uniref:trypsin-like serine peptidase n=1 Tax=Streptomyces sp. B1866 TaxID=3075431 RepID=UPI0028917AE0|nr:hypothetical protein [Streptomyces sp. B1866]